MKLHTVALSGITAQAWRNGGGVTRELLAWPTPDAWRVRVSVADVATDGPFSAFPGVERWFTVIDGAGVELQFTDRRVRADGRSAPRRFDGGDAPAATLIGGPTRDLNLMLQGGRGLMQRAHPDDPFRAEGAWAGLYAADAVRLVTIDGEDHALPAGTLAWTDGPLIGHVEAPAKARAWWLALETSA